ncbi:helix-turn-helix domain-containing protein [Flavobacterium pectinovorum]|uniref:Helix-turn-helix domain-containing protein n=1 Tax=Flavobacterium pectinovorum TaxID=29533 RepID=A0A502F247_9FLAO|nr:helix-turn-helix domain-containing protein [Flavobacterium pectinovorum]TPG44103.1 helix-turn-helix domain-containing protein [Flavobacterium pectinovorum]
MRNIPIRHISEQIEPELLGSFTIREITSLLSDKDMVQEVHRHDFYYILIVKNGKGHHEIDFINYEIKNHTVFIMRPGQVHSLSLKEGSTGFLIQFKTDFLYSHNSASQNHLTKLIQYNSYNLKEEGFDKIETILLEALKEYTCKLKGYQEVLKASLSIFLIELLRQRQDEVIPVVRGSVYGQEKLEQFLELVEKNSITHKQISQYTGLLNLSSYQLSAITKTLLDKTPSEIINQHIILEAKRQLLATSRQVSQIAYHLGYDDASYFARFFKKHTGLSPESFRQNSK